MIFLFRHQLKKPLSSKEKIFHSRESVSLANNQNRTNAVDDPIFITLTISDLTVSLQFEIYF